MTQIYLYILIGSVISKIWQEEEEEEEEEEETCSRRKDSNLYFLFL